MLQPFSEQLKHQIIGIQEYGNSRGGNHSVMNIYKSDKYARQAVLSLDICFLSFDNIIPEDICFYKNENIWISTVTHEKYAFMYTDSDDDVNFLNQNNIHCYYMDETTNVYKLPKQAVEFNGEKYSKGY